MGVQISPSILSADFTDLAADVARIAPAADWVHVDVMDNHFVPNLTIGLPVVERLAEVSDLPLDVHLMIADVDRWAPDYADAGTVAATYIKAAPDRMVWGSDWPHPSEPKEHKPDDARLFDLFAQCAGDAAAFKRILVDNPAELYGFPKVTP